MKEKERTYAITLKGSRNYNSVSVTEGFTISVDDGYNQLEFESMKTSLKDKLTQEVKKLINDFDTDLRIDETIDLGDL